MKFLCWWSVSAVLTVTVFAAEPKVLYEEDPALLTTTISVVVHTGSVDDPALKTGVANLMGELMLRGTKKKNRSKFQSELERMGGALAVRTTHEAMSFDGKVIKENTFAFLKLLEECLLTPAFGKKDFEVLKNEQLAEIRHRKNQNARLAGMALRKEMFAGTPLERPVDGTVSSVARIQLEDVMRSYNDQFHQGNIFFAVASPYKEAEMKKELTGIWSKFVDGARRDRKPFTVQMPDKPRLVVVHKPNTTTGSMLMGTVGITATDPARWNLFTGNFAFGGEPLVSRLFRTIRGELGWTYAIITTYHAMGSLSYQPSMFAMSSTPSVEFTGKTMLKFMSMWKEYLTNGLKAEEMVLAQESQINSYPFEFESAEKRLSQRVYAYMNGLTVLSPEEYAKKIKSTDNNTLKQALKEHHSPDKWIVAVVADKAQIEKQLAEEQAEVPEAERLKIFKVLTPDQVILDNEKVSNPADLAITGAARKSVPRSERGAKGQAGTVPVTN